MLRRWGHERWRSRTRVVGVAAVLVACSFLASGCDTVNGGGWIQSLSGIPGEKATFGFTAKCKTRTVLGIPEAVFYEGQFQFDDHAFSPGVRVHGDVEPNEFFTVVGQSCQDVSAELSLVTATAFQGEYRTQSDALLGGQGEFFVFAADGGKRSSGIPDEICVDLVGAVVYTNCGLVQGGNVSVQ